MTPPLRSESPSMRNLYRNMIAQAINAVLPGAQRNNTSRDAKAMVESTDFSSANNIINLGDSPMFGVDSAGE